MAGNELSLNGFLSTVLPQAEVSPPLELSKEFSDLESSRKSFQAGSHQILVFNRSEYYLSFSYR